MIFGSVFFCLVFLVMTKEAVFKPARDDGGLATVSMQVGEYGAVLFGRLRRLTALTRLRAAQQLSNDSTQVSFQTSKIFF